jgi:hypothetical protein
MPLTKITSSGITNNAISADKIASGTITTAKIADDAVTSAKIAASAITTVKIANDAVSADKIASGTITTAKIADDAVTSGKIANNTIANADISSTAGITLNKISGNTSFKNIVINGDMRIAQRNTSLASITSTGYRTCDRWLFEVSSFGTWTQSQSTDTPSGYGFSNSLKLDCTTADASPAAADYLQLVQIFEGQNLQYLKKGTANAVSLTASFWVKSTKTGTFIAELFDNDNNRSISKSYTVSVTNTWEFKTITFDGDTTSALDNDISGSLYLVLWLGAGSNYTSGTLNTSWGSRTSANIAVGQVNAADSTANDFFITGVQLEAGTSATDFEFLPIDVSLRRCLRYFWQPSSGTGGFSGVFGGGPNAVITFPYPAPMRSAPTMTYISGGIVTNNSGTDRLATGFSNVYSAGLNSYVIYVNLNGNGISGHGAVCYGMQFSASSEL